MAEEGVERRVLCELLNVSVLSKAVVQVDVGLLLMGTSAQRASRRISQDAQGDMDCCVGLGSSKPVIDLLSLALVRGQDGEALA